MIACKVHNQSLGVGPHIHYQLSVSIKTEEETPESSSIFPSIHLPYLLSLAVEAVISREYIDPGPRDTFRGYDCRIEQRDQGFETQNHSYE